MHTRRTAFAAIAMLAATLTACSSDEPSQGTAQRATDAASSAPASEIPDCGPDSQLTQAEWAQRCAGAEQETPVDQPDTELGVGDTFAYTDGIKVKVIGITTITRFGEYDDRPDADRTPFRVAFTVTNGTSTPYDLDDLSYDAEGATTGGQTEALYVQLDSKLMTGRLVPGRTVTFTAEYAIAKSDGKDIVFTMLRLDEAWLEDGSFFGEDPHWTGTIK